MLYRKFNEKNKRLISVLFSLFSSKEGAANNSMLYLHLDREKISTRKG